MYVTSFETVLYFLSILFCSLSVSIFALTFQFKSFYLYILKFNISLLSHIQRTIEYMKERLHFYVSEFSFLTVPVKFMLALPLDSMYTTHPFYTAPTFSMFSQIKTIKIAI